MNGADWAGVILEGIGAATGIWAVIRFMEAQWKEIEFIEILAGPSA